MMDTPIAVGRKRSGQRKRLPVVPSPVDVLPAIPGAEEISRRIWKFHAKREDHRRIMATPLGAQVRSPCGVGYARFRMPCSWSARVRLGRRRSGRCSHHRPSCSDPSPYVPSRRKNWKAGGDGSSPRRQARKRPLSAPSRAGTSSTAAWNSAADHRRFPCAWPDLFWSLPSLAVLRLSGQGVQ